MCRTLLYSSPPRLLVLALVAVSAFTPACAVHAGIRQTFTDPHDGAFDASAYLSEHRLGFLPVPVIITEPAVGTGAGVMGVFFHESRAQKQERLEASADNGKPLLPANISLAGAAGTENGTWGAGIGHLGFWDQDRVRYRGFLGYASLNLDFYSLGGRQLSRAVELNVEGPALFNEVKVRLGSGRWFLGARQIYREVDTAFAGSSEVDRLPPLDAAPAVGRFLDFNLDRTTATSGAGLLAEYDSTVNPFDPERGLNYRFSYLWFDDAIGSDVDYETFNFTALHYWTVSRKLVLSLRVQYDGLSADDDTRLPAFVPPAVDLRGISATRYQGNDVLVAEAALDYKLNRRWKIGTFLGAGRAAQTFDDLGESGSAVSRGVGFRYLIARRYGFVMGLDVAKGPDDTAFYVQAGATW